jgi:hypothetical protein
VKPLSDTTDDARERLLAYWRAASPEDRYREMVRLNRMVRSLAQAGQDLRYPDATPEERRLRLASLWIPREAMIRWWGWDPEVHGR